MPENLKVKLGNKWPIFEELHLFILSLNPKITYRIFTIYVTYYLGEEIIAIAFFRGKFVLDCQLDVGFALMEKPKISNFTDAKYMKYPGINYSIKLNNRADITKEVIKTIKSTIIK